MGNAGSASHLLSTFPLNIFFCPGVIVHFLSLEDSGQKLICCFCLFCSGLVIIYLKKKKTSYLTLSGPSLSPP